MRAFTSSAGGDAVDRWRAGTFTSHTKVTSSFGFVLVNFPVADDTEIGCFRGGRGRIDTRRLRKLPRLNEADSMS